MTGKFVKVLFDVDPEDDWDGQGGPETVWAEPIEGKEGEHFRIMNSPFHAKGVSFLDVVKASFLAGSNLVFNFETVVERGGHSTFVLFMTADDPRNEAYWNMLERMGCSYESGTIVSDDGERLLYSVDVPPTTDIHDVYEMLERGNADNVWIFQEGFVSPAHKTQD
ncbi:MAG TPA: DUF4265 domain-containing protein [Candidatus Binatia bacterium]|nr:DUF4265 domain-containing protein [Candidatus Binatia bacterium]